MKSPAPVALLVCEGIHSALLKNAGLPNLETCVFNSVEEFLVTARDIKGFSALVSIAETSGRELLVDPVSLCVLVPNVPIIRLITGYQSSISLLHPRKLELPLEIECLNDVSLAISNLIDSPKKPNLPPIRLTKIQTAFLQSVAEGMSNLEIAQLREVSVRNIESIERRTFERLGLQAKASSRAKTLAAYRYINENPLSGKTQQATREG
jgi:DNA-binding CsgD family transcriptional regulator